MKTFRDLDHVAGVTPPDRDRYMDFLRAASVAVVARFERQRR